MKIFGIGMFKTGTTSLGHAMEVLGYNCFNGPWKNEDEFPYDPWNKTPEIYQRNKENLIAKVEQFDAFQDYPFMFAYRELDEWFPESKFILTTRDPESLAVSDMKMWERQDLAQQTEVPKIGEFISRYESHLIQVQEYFANRPSDLLVVSWFDGDGWEQLCDFLGMPVPQTPFPISNAADHKKASIYKKIKSKLTRGF